MALRILTHAEQVAAHLRVELLRGRWTGQLPGAERLGAELDVNHTTISAALRLLEKEGLLVFRGVGRRRQILLPESIAPPSMRVMILLYEKSDGKYDYMVDLMHRLSDAGHVAAFASKSLLDLKMDTERIKRLVRKTDADAWIIFAGSQELLQWFAEQPKPAFALAGRRRSVRIAGSGPDKVSAERAAVQRLIELGHKRMVMLAREERRKPVPGLMERTFLDELETQGIETGSYNLPDWEDSPAGLYRCLNSLFEHTPPTAMIIDDVPLFLAVERHLARLGFLAPQHVSLICLDPSPAFTWYTPSVAHINWDSRPLVRRIVRWAQNVARGKDDYLQGSTKATFVEGGTIGPAAE